VNEYLLIAIISSILSAFSQVLLKKSSLKKYESKFREYFNLYVIGGYFITFVCMILMVIAYRGLQLKVGIIIETLVYAYIMILSRLFFNEKITWKKLLGNTAIIIGVIVFVIE